MHILYSKLMFLLHTLFVVCASYVIGADELSFYTKMNQTNDFVYMHGTASRVQTFSRSQKYIFGLYNHYCSFSSLDSSC